MAEIQCVTANAPAGLLRNQVFQSALRGLPNMEIIIASHLRERCDKCGWTC